MSIENRSEFLVISRGQWNKDATPSEIQQAIDDFYTWLARSIEQGQMRMGSRLGLEGATVSMKGIVTDGPYGEAKEAVGGYWSILADNLEEASKIAAGNPCMKCGLFYEIRPLDPTCCSADRVTTETCER